MKVHEQDKKLTELEQNVGADLQDGPSSSEEIEKLREELEKQQAYTRRYNLVVKGISRRNDETNSDIQTQFEQYFLYKLRVSSLNFDKIHRLADPNLVLVHFVCLRDQDRVLDARRKCGTCLYNFIITRGSS